jgi:hypothetical protein
MRVNSSQEQGGELGVWLRVSILNSLVFSLRTTVRAIRSSYWLESQMVSHFMSPQAGPPTLPADFSQITIPFELVNEHIFITACRPGVTDLKLKVL